MMETVEERVSSMDWTAGESALAEKGYYHHPNLVSNEECEICIRNYNEHSAYRKTVNMERYRFGKGEYKYFNYPLPKLVQELRQCLYPRLIPLANSWMRQLKMENHYPATLHELLSHCARSDQRQATPLILKYGAGGFNTLHQDLYGGVYFPFQAVVLLSEPHEDFRGGEFVLLQQTPRAQSKAIVLTPRKGDLIIFTTNFRPVKGKSGYYRAAVKHGVSEVTWGVRYTLGIIFHDALT